MTNYSNTFRFVSEVIIKGQLLLGEGIILMLVNAKWLLSKNAMVSLTLHSLLWLHVFIYCMQSKDMNIAQPH